MEYKYKKAFFNPKTLLRVFPSNDDSQVFDKADRRDGRIYLYDNDIILAINIAMATGRVLLVAGRSGCGKSSLAYNVARVLERRYYEYVVTSRTQARDLLWQFDSVARLADAQTNTTKGIHNYLHPGVLWWVFDKVGAENRGQDQDTAKEKIDDIAIYDPSLNKNKKEQAIPAVVLIDEIDKADTDFPNNLLVVLGSSEFDVCEIEKRVSFSKSQTKQKSEDWPLIIVTTNGERKLPEAFLRRCIVLEIEFPTIDALVKIAEAVEGEGEENRKLYEKIAKKMAELTIDMGELGEKDSDFDSSKSLEKKVTFSIAEFLDTVRAIKKLEMDISANVLPKIFEMILQKKRELD